MGTEMETGVCLTAGPLNGAKVVVEAPFVSILLPPSYRGAVHTLRINYESGEIRAVSAGRVEHVSVDMARAILVAAGVEVGVVGVKSMRDSLRFVSAIVDRLDAHQRAQLEALPIPKTLCPREVTGVVSHGSVAADTYDAEQMRRVYARALRSGWHSEETLDEWLDRILEGRADRGGGGLQ